MFADSAKIYVKSGNGGNGHVSFRRELFVAAGGPDGGDGGDGGDVIIEVDKNINTLNEFRFVRKYYAKDGDEGGKKRCHGKDGEDIIIKVPEGTVVKEAESGKVIVDMSGENKREIILKGGRGGKGNMNYATPTMQVPTYAQPGKPGIELTLILELKLIADVGLVGYPNVGKSTILSRCTNAKPKIANYHFTTLHPNLGVVDLGGGTGFVIVDIHGLIEGAADGVGLGHQFLRHIERTRVIVHVVDISGSEGRDPIEDIKNINKEPWVTKYGYSSNPSFMLETGEKKKRKKWVYTKQQYEDRAGFEGGKTYIWEVEKVLRKRAISCDISTLSYLHLTFARRTFIVSPLPRRQILRTAVLRNGRDGQHRARREYRRPYMGAIRIHQNVHISTVPHLLVCNEIPCIAAFRSVFFSQKKASLSRDCTPPFALQRFFVPSAPHL